MFKTELETELEKALKEKGISFMEMNREQIDCFVQADFEKYPEYKQVLENKAGDGEINPDFEAIVKKAIEAGITIKENSARFEIASRLLHEAFQTKLGTYKTRTALVNDFTICYRVVIDPIDNPEEAYANKDLHEFIVVSRQLKDSERKLLIFQYNMDLKLYSLKLIDEIEDYAPLKGIISFIDYRDKIRKYQHLLNKMKDNETMPEPPALSVKKLASDLMRLMDV